MSNKSQMSMHGRHDPDDVYVGRWASPETKAFYTIVANEVGCSVTELIDVGINAVASRYGMLVDGKMTPAVEQAVSVLGPMIRANLAAKRAKRKAGNK